MPTSWVKSIVMTAASAIALGASGTVLAAIVVASSGPSAAQFPAGKKIDNNQSITLRAGDSVTILDRQGTRVLRGAGSFKPADAGGANRSSTFAALTRQRGSQRVRTGAVRNAGPAGAVMSPNLWFVDLSKPGTKCVVEGTPVRLWRADDAKPATYRVLAADGAASSVSFDAGSMIGNWDSTATPVADGTTFTIATDNGPALGRFGFSVLPTQPDNPEDLASTLIEKGCSAQVELLAASLSAQAG